MIRAAVIAAVMLAAAPAAVLAQDAAAAPLGHVDVARDGMDRRAGRFLQALGQRPDRQGLAGSGRRPAENRGADRREEPNSGTVPHGRDSARRP